jgi:nucleotide-binding universal stress UspA family protein
LSTEKLFQRLLVPLDGSRLAETALPAAAFLASRFQARVTLIHLIERNAPPAVHSERHLTEPLEAQAYLQQAAQQAFPAGLQVEQHVHTSEVSDVARGLVEHAAELQIDLIVMCSHGRGGLRDLLFGSIAQQVVGLGTTPVLLIRPTPAGQAPPFACRLILVPLDGDPAHEDGLPVARDLARACGGALHLVMVIRDVGSLKGEQAATALLMPLATNALLDMTEKQAEGYLNEHITRLRAAGLSVTAEVARGDPVPYLLSAAQRTGADLIVLGTHGKAGLEAFWSGSVAPRLSGRSHAPLLLLPLADGNRADPL